MNLEEIKRLFLMEGMSGRDISSLPECSYSKSSIYRLLKKTNAVELKNSIQYRFWSKVDIGKENECWEWKGSIRNKDYPYGVIKYKNRQVGTHRISYFLKTWEWPNDMCVCHHCDNPRCVNPNHLFLGTHSDNMKDAYNKGRLNINNISDSKNQFKKGHIPKNCEMGLEKAKKVKGHIMHDNRNISLKELSNKYDIKYQTAKDISAGRSYINI